MSMLDLNFILAEIQWNSKIDFYENSKKSSIFLYTNHLHIPSS